MTGTTLNKTKSKGKTFDYIRICAGPCNNKYVHRLIAEALLRRRLLPHETVDHKDQNPKNCDPGNLIVLSWKDHGKLTRYREAKARGQVEFSFAAGIDYEIILDGSEFFA